MSTVEQLKKQLVEQGFLALTREYEAGIPETLEFALDDGLKVQLLDTGVIVFEPSSPANTDLVISSGVHGNETAPIEIVDDLVRRILMQELSVHNRVLCIIGNPVAMNMSQRFDIENMNRLFNGKHQGKEHHEALRAKRLEDYVKDFFGKREDATRCHYDLHTAIRGSKYARFSIYPYPDGRDWNKEQLSFMLASDINTILLGHQPSGTFSYFSSHQFEAHAFTVELGKVKPFGENTMSDFAAITANLSTLIEGKTVNVKAFDNEDFNLFEVKDELLKKSESFALNISDDLENFSSFDAGFQLSEDSDGGYRVEEDGEAIVFPNAKVPVGQRAGLVVRKTRI
ncbi:succinylglutamate desuccinylase [Pleionea sp. CnH1-48]|uniref:succinylglutamate desuccinylase n=1 Tax=Pleionea sp. CnH1-48 TaxID=2954494 RepID=UPI0020977898|nr:succinylglutamate desuccinylase [Pleionea sp. CnH1-48]MCO7225408.1 succinylglutamate desuccinylase [Pleionea sp. CnH1-48]